MDDKRKNTRFRAYQIGEAGSSFSYFDGNEFTLIEARLNETNAKSVKEELKECCKTEIDILHITSWDQDHCCSKDLEAILKYLMPKIIECPGYPIDKSKQNQVDCVKLIYDYTMKHNVECRVFDVQFCKSLPQCKQWSTENIVFNPKLAGINLTSANDNSSIKFFRSGHFSVLSLGDHESEEVSMWLGGFDIVQNEVDILILAHHGSDNGFTTNEFLKAVKPKFAICTVNRANQYSHPDQAIRDRLKNNNIKIKTTKDGDVIIDYYDEKNYRVRNYISGTTRLGENQEIRTTKRNDKSSNDLRLAIENYMDTLKRMNSI